MENEKGFKGFIASAYGKIILNIVMVVICYGALILIANSEIPWLMIPLALACTIFGWKTLGETNPFLMIFASGNFMIFYFIVKFILSVIIGYFVMPFKISRFIVKSITATEE